jgi:hypothetical protein
VIFISFDFALNIILSIFSVMNCKKLYDFFDKNLLSLEGSLGKPLLYVKKILPQNVVLETDDRTGGKLRHHFPTNIICIDAHC